MTTFMANFNKANKLLRQGCEKEDEKDEDHEVDDVEECSVPLPLVDVGNINERGRH